MGRKFSWNVYMSVFVITLVLFLAGVYIGIKINDLFLIEFEQEIESLAVKMHSYELLFLLDNSDMSCELYTEYVDYFDTETYRVGANLEYMERHQGIEDRDLKKKYFEMEMRDFLISRKMIKQCGVNQSIILYFYSNIGCPLCKDQGFELDKLKTEINLNQTKVRVYSFDGTYEDSAIIRALKKEFDISEYPTLIINGEKYEGLRRAQEIKNRLI